MGNLFSNKVSCVNMVSYEAHVVDSKICHTAYRHTIFSVENFLRSHVEQNPPPVLKAKKLSDIDKQKIITFEVWKIMHKHAALNSHLKGRYKSISKLIVVDEEPDSSKPKSDATRPRTLTDVKCCDDSNCVLCARGRMRSDSAESA
jgi:hypothetical protein